MKIIVLLCIYYLLPLFNQELFFSIILLLAVNPLFSFVLAYNDAKKFGVNFLFSIVVGLLFIPSIFIYYNSTAYVYGIVYTMISFIGSFIGNYLADQKHNLESAQSKKQN